MSMSACENCLENSWSYECIDKWITATCNLCANEVEFEAKKEKAPEMGEHIPCRKCGGKIILIVGKPLTKKKKKKQTYAFSHSYKCSECKTRFLDNKFRFEIKHAPEPKPKSKNVSQLTIDYSELGSKPL